MHAIHLNGLAAILWYLQITFIDLLPKLLIGQTWIWASYRDLFKNRKLIKGYKNRFIELQEENDSHVTIFEVVEKLRLSVKSKKINKFKP